MKREEYVESIVYNGQMVNIGVDDAGQQYFFEFMNKKGELEEVGCGAYNGNYLDTIKEFFGDEDASDISPERTAQILYDFLSAEIEECGECAPVRDTLADICGVTREEAEELGIGYIFDGADEEEMNAAEEVITKTCANCVNCIKGEQRWVCENCSASVGMPVYCDPPHDEACNNWSLNPEDADKPIDEMYDYDDEFDEDEEDEDALYYDVDEDESDE